MYIRETKFCPTQKQLTVKAKRIPPVEQTKYKSYNWCEYVDFHHIFTFFMKKVTTKIEQSN